MPVTLDVERTWKVTCQQSDCGRRTYMLGETPEAAAKRAVQKVAWVLDEQGRIWCPFHGRTS